MADLNELQAAGIVKVIGSDVSGVETNPLVIDTNGAIKVKRPVARAEHTITGLGEELVLDVSDGYATAIIIADGIHTGTHAYYISLDGTNFSGMIVPAWSANSSTYLTTNDFSDGGSYYIDVTGIKKIKVISDITSGTATVSINAGEAPTGLLSQLSSDAASISGAVVNPEQESATFTNGSGNHVVGMNNQLTVFFDVSGTWTGSISVQHNYSTPQTLRVRKLGTTASLTSITTNGAYIVEATWLDGLEFINSIATGSASLFIYAVPNLQNDKHVYQAGDWNVGVTSMPTVTVQDGGSSITVDGPVTDAQLRATPVSVSLSNNNVLVHGNTYFGAASLSATGNFLSDDLYSYKEMRMQLSGTYVASVVVEGSMNNTTFYSLPYIKVDDPSGQPSVAAITTNGLYYIPISARYIRIRVSSYTSGTVTATFNLNTAAASDDLGARFASIIGSGNTATVTASNALKVDGSAVTQPVSGPLTDTELRATAVPVSGTVTANAGTGTFAVSGPLTDAQLRASAVPVTQTTPLFKGRANTFRTPGRAGTAGQKILSLFNAGGSPVTLTVAKVSVDLYQTVVKAVTVAPPIVRLWKITAAPTNGTVLTKNKIGGSTSSNASVEVRGDTSADGTGSATTLTATLPAGTIITQEFAPRLITAAGYEAADRMEFLGDTTITLAAAEGLCLFLDYTLATQNPTTDMWISGIEWSES